MQARPITLSASGGGQEAISGTVQHADRMARRSDGLLHHVETWVTQREIWRRTPAGWKLYRVDSIRDQVGLSTVSLANARPLTPFAEDVWVDGAPVRFLGMRFTATMTVLCLGDGNAVSHDAGAPRRGRGTGTC